jgi:hypothetical protein
VIHQRDFRDSSHRNRPEVRLAGDRNAVTYTAAGTRMNSASRTRCEAFRDPHGSRLVHSSSYSANSLRPLYRHDRITDYGGRNRRNERARVWGRRLSEQRLDWLAARRRHVGLWLFVPQGCWVDRRRNLKSPGAEAELTAKPRSVNWPSAARAQICGECPYNLKRNPYRKRRPCLSPAAFSPSSPPPH